MMADKYINFHECSLLLPIWLPLPTQYAANDSRHKAFRYFTDCQLLYYTFVFSTTIPSHSKKTLRNPIAEFK